MKHLTYRHRIQQFLQPAPGNCQEPVPQMTEEFLQYVTDVLGPNATKYGMWQTADMLELALSISASKSRTSKAVLGGTTAAENN